jgi:hypothetical protein
MEHPDTWLVVYYVATFVIAMVALLGLALSFRTARQTSAALVRIQDGFRAYTEPLVVFSGFQWVNDRGDEPISTENIPKGIRIIYKNVSNIPIQIHSTDFRSAEGNRVHDRSGPVIALHEQMAKLNRPNAEADLLTVESGNASC